MIDEIRDVDPPWRQGFLAKSTTLVVLGRWLLRTDNDFRVIRVFRGLKRERGDTAHSVSEAGALKSDLPGRSPDLTMQLANQHEWTRCKGWL
jgi:hypothetical protein